MWLGVQLSWLTQTNLNPIWCMGRLGQAFLILGLAWFRFSQPKFMVGFELKFKQSKSNSNLIWCFYNVYNASYHLKQYSFSFSNLKKKYIIIYYIICFSIFLYIYIYICIHINLCLFFCYYLKILSFLLFKISYKYIKKVFL